MQKKFEGPSKTLRAEGWPVGRGSRNTPTSFWEAHSIWLRASREFSPTTLQFRAEVWRGDAETLGHRRQLLAGLYSTKLTAASCLSLKTRNSSLPLHFWAMAKVWRAQTSPNPPSSSKIMPLTSVCVCVYKEAIIYMNGVSLVGGRENLFATLTMEPHRLTDANWRTKLLASVLD